MLKSILVSSQTNKMLDSFSVCCITIKISRFIFTVFNTNGGAIITYK